MEAQAEITKEDLEAVRLVVRRAEDLCTALTESDDVGVLGSDFELQFKALLDALAGLPEGEAASEGNWSSVAEDWLQDAPGG
ncbi:MAG: hypothetical protein O6949_00110 [Chloroflexi bacterium]|nr:hypothetical protein [Chloroflexota bacterium]